MELMNIFKRKEGPQVIVEAKQVNQYDVIGIEVIEPETAAKWLEKNDAGRNLRLSVVKLYAEEMASGAWKINGETIKFSSDGGLLDGQHRLNACVLAGVPFASYVIRGVSAAAFDTMDTGRNRSAKDILDIMHVPYSAYVARALRLLMYWETDRYTHIPMPRSRMKSYLDNNPGIVDSAEFVRGLVKKNGSVVPSTLSVFGHYLFNKVDPEKGREFFERLYDGIGLEDRDPIYMLRQRFIRAVTSGMSMRDQQQVILLIKAWNMFYMGDARSFLRFQKGKDATPLIAGLVVPQDADV